MRTVRLDVNSQSVRQGARTAYHATKTKKRSRVDFQMCVTRGMELFHFALMCINQP